MVGRQSYNSDGKSWQYVPSHLGTAGKIFMFWTYLYFGYFFASSAVIVCIVALVVLLTAPFDRNRRIAHFVATLWGYHYIAINPWWRVHWQGVENIDKHKTYVLVSNHQSVADIVLLYGIFRSFKYVAKEETMKIPFIGWNLILNQYVRIKRGDLKSVKVMMDQCREWLNRGASLMIFPEGTRTEDGELLEFKDGAFRLACDAKVPVVPIVLDGTGKIKSKNTKSLNFNVDLYVTVLPEVNPADFNYKSRPLKDHVRALMAKKLSEIRAEEAKEIPTTVST
jgi:1-acyl-sn-glycerol-3-phosphate acyltransferase